ncbi:thiamine phosphate synthase [Asaia sp. W19]|uniref:thiamine phosphate synthase n=1 Tax=unclassified Asaia TaxID=2685023 RepID=UPI000F8CE7D6|nr:thiamine phosphate synthase [Asaia sp. W19]RUT24618.1 thiamine phosphate synthase [Asaia sp. W19]
MLPCELYLVTMPDFDPSRELNDLVKVLERWTPAALRLGTSEENRARHCVKAIRETVQSLGTALILTDLPALASELGCDGVHLTSSPAQCLTAREELGRDLQLGVYCGTSRDDAMHAGELGADYISVAPNAPDLVAWWSQMMELPVIAEGIETAEEASAMIKANADFLAVPLSFVDADEAGARLEAIISRAAAEYPG